LVRWGSFEYELNSCDESTFVLRNLDIREQQSWCEEQEQNSQNKLGKLKQNTRVPSPPWPQ
jgi:hypothetical protein